MVCAAEIASPTSANASTSVAPSIVQRKLRGGSRPSHSITPVKDHQTVTVNSTASSSSSSGIATGPAYQAGCTLTVAGSAFDLTGMKYMRANTAAPATLQKARLMPPNSPPACLPSSARCEHANSRCRFA